MVRIENQRTVPVIFIGVAILLAAARFTWWAVHQNEEGEGRVRWVAPAEGRAIAAKTGKPILYDFTAEWCGPCHLLDAAVFQNPRLAAAINEKFVPVRVMDRQREDGANRPDVAALQAQYQIEAFPTVVFADSGGIQQERIEGYRGPEHFEEVMGKIR